MKHLLALLTLAALCLRAPAEPVISEFMADNRSILLDEDGEFSDWIEIHNPTPKPIDLTGWKLTDDVENPGKWTFPQLTLQAGEFRVFFASEKSALRPDHVNFKLAADGEYLALVRPDGTTAQQFAPAYPRQAGDESFGMRFATTPLVQAGAATRYRVPASDPIGWQDPSYNHSAWSQGPSGLGFGITEPGITARQVFKNGTISGLADANALLALPAGSTGIRSETSKVVATVNFLGDGSDGRFGFNASPPGGSGDHYAIEATGFVHITTAGYYTFGLNSDDGGSITINSTNVMVDDSFHGPEDRTGIIYLTVGAHPFRVVMFQGAGGNGLEFYAAPGIRSGWIDGVYRLVGDTANGGLAATTAPTGSTGVTATNLQSAMGTRTSAFFRQVFSANGPGTATSLALVMRYNDGFEAWLNGTRVAAANTAAAPAAWDAAATTARTTAETLQRQAFNLTAFLPNLTSGSNLLAVQGLRSSASDPSFLVLPELIAGTPDPALAPAFYGNGLATPGWMNGPPSILGKVADTQFSVKRGFFTKAFSLAITTATPGATIRYTTDGSTPTATTGTVYTKPVVISTTTNLRAAAFLTGYQPANVDTQTYLFPAEVIRQQANGAAPTGWPSSSGTDQVLDFGMDPDIVNHANPDVGGTATVTSALLALPSIVLTTDLPNYFNINGSQGFFANPYGRGFAWERPVSVEWINPPDALNPNGTSGFQIDAGVRMRGGYSRSTANPKHAFHLYFREDYGTAKLEFPLFGRHGASSFDRIDLRTSQNYSWSFEGNSNNTFLREEGTRQAQLDMGQPGSRVRYVHLYLNGIYWGLFDLDERTEAAFSASYFGGNKDEYDVVKAEQESNYITGATDGDLNAWKNLWDQSRNHETNPTNTHYFKMMGLAADGVTRTADPVLLDVDNLIDYLLLTFYSGNLDGCMSAFLGNDRPNNWFGSRRASGNPGQGFRFYVHDFEHTFFSIWEDRTGPWTPTNQANFAYSNPYYLHRDLIGNTEYRMRWADRVRRHLYQDGALTPTAWANRLNKLAAAIDLPIVAESARWGDAKSATPLTKAHWLEARNNLINTINARHNNVLDQLRADNLYPSLEAPQIFPPGGYQPSGVSVTMTGPAGATLYYMPDGSDPRAVGGAIRPGAQVFVPSSSQDTLIPWNAPAWRYLADGSNQGTGWRDLDFNDSAWPSGTAELGYGNGDEATVIPRPTPRYATTYFRKTFTVSNPETITQLSARVEYDDAYAVYLNGTRIAGNLPINPAYNYFSGNAINDTIETTDNVPASLLRAGANVIAVEIHQANNTSSDISMNLSLTATRTHSSTPLTLTGTGDRPLRARAHNAGTWSALTETTFQLNSSKPAAINLAFSEIMYHPVDPSAQETAAGFTNPEDFEFIEIVNLGATSVDLRGMYFYDAIRFDFNAAGLTSLAPGARLVLACNAQAFAFRYGTQIPIAGTYSGNLSNSGETVTLQAADDSIIRQVTYRDTDGWPTEPDGRSGSLIPLNPANAALDSDPSAWRVSLQAQGNPGTSDASTFPAWLASHQETNPLADADGDGWTNLLEYALAGHPKAMDPVPGLQLTFENDGSGDSAAALPVLSHTVRYGADDVTVVLEGAAEPTGEWTPAGPPLSRMRHPNGTETLVHRVDSPLGTLPMRFWRLRVALKN